MVAFSRAFFYGRRGTWSTDPLASAPAFFFFQRVGANYGAWVLRFGVVFGSLVGALGTCLLRLVNHRESRVHVAVDWYNSKNVRVALFRLGET